MEPSTAYQLRVLGQITYTLSLVLHFFFNVNNFVT